MAMMPCTECGHTISDKAASCPKCGAPVVTAATPATTPSDSPPASNRPPASASESPSLADVEWFYLASNGEQLGPVDAVFMRAAFQDGRIQAGTMVWRDGLAEWVPLQQVAAAMGLDGVSPPATSPPPPKSDRSITGSDEKRTDSKANEVSNTASSVPPLVKNNTKAGFTKLWESYNTIEKTGCGCLVVILAFFLLGGFFAIVGSFMNTNSNSNSESAANSNSEATSDSASNSVPKQCIGKDHYLLGISMDPRWDEITNGEQNEIIQLMKSGNFQTGPYHVDEKGYCHQQVDVSGIAQGNSFNERFDALLIQ